MQLNKLENSIVDILSELTKDRPAFFHFDVIGFLRVGIDRRSRLSAINEIFRKVGKNGGNLLIPSYSYSFTDNKIYSVRDSECSLGPVFEYLRKENPEIRTNDPIFSYLNFGNLISNSKYNLNDYECFGPKSLIEDVYNMDGLLISTGGKLHYSTEIHYIEKRLNVSYRFDKKFHGEMLDIDQNLQKASVVYFCRDLDFANEHNVTVSFEKLMQDAIKNGLVEKICINDMFEVEVIKFKSLLAFIGEKIKENPFYLMKKNE